VRFLIDESLSTRVATLLRDAGHDAIHVADRDLLGAEDSRVMAAAAAEQRVLVRHRLRRASDPGPDPGPSVVMLRQAPRRPEAQVGLILANVEAAESELTRGACWSWHPAGRASVRFRSIGRPDH
jgi:predicted nuclease of predicted toxin-antitoxin system